MSKARYVRMTSPGLPSWPALMFDAEQRRGVISFRLVTWRSWVLADRTTRVINGICVLLFAWWLWNWLGFFEEVIPRGFLTLLGSCMMMSFTTPILGRVLPGFLARQIFARRSTVWFTPDAIAFRSPLYANGVVIWRSWNNIPIQVRFDLTPDSAAAEARLNLPREKDEATRFRNAHLATRMQSAHVLRLLISAFDPHRHATSSAPATMGRAIPMLEIDLHAAQQLTVVLAAAAALTAEVSLPTAPQHGGVDIDANPT